MASVTFQNVSKEYDGGFVAVRDLNLEIEDGEFVVLVGPSGCGKTTTLRMVAGLETITSGAISIGSRVVNDIRPRDRDIAMVFQNYALYPHMTVRKNLAFALKMRKTPRDEIKQRVAWAAEVLGLEPLLDRKPRALSGGQRQRVALGRAMVRKPAVFLFDEPLSNLDAKLRVEMRAEIKRLHRQLRTTTVYVTHDQEEAMSLGDRVAVISAGELHQCDAPLTVYNHPVNRFVAGFLGAPPMNFLTGDLERVTGQTWLRRNALRLQIDASAIHAETAAGPAIAGIRPESIELRREAQANGQNCWTATVRDVEPLGASMDVFFEVDGLPTMVCRTAARTLEVGAVVGAYLPPDRIHLFPPEEVRETREAHGD